MLSDIEVFVRVVEAGSFTETAAQMQMSKSVVSKYISRLEAKLNVRLLNRSTRRLSLTEPGRQFYRRCKDSLGEINAAIDELTQLDSEPRGVLRLNMPMSFGVLHVAPLLAAFRQHYPAVELDVNLDDRKLEVIEPGFDVSIRIARLMDSSLVAKPLGPCRHVVVAAPAYLAEHGCPQTVPDLADHQIISYRHQQSALDWHFDHPEHGQQSLRLRSSTQFNSSLAQRQMVVAGGGIARMPSFAVAEDIHNGVLQQLLADYRCPALTIYALYPQRRYLSPKVKAFVEFMAQSIGDQPAWDRLLA